MQVELLDTFLELVSCRSFHRAAERLGVTQSTVSSRVQALEAAVGGRLFDRSRAGVALTTEGLKFEPFARSLRREWAESLRAVGSGAQGALSLRLGIQHDLATSHIGEWVVALRETLPGAAFYIELDYSTQTCAEILSGGLDFGVIFTPRALPDLHFETLGEIRYRLVSTEAGSSVATLRADTHIRAEYSPAFTAQARRLLPKLGDAPLASGHEAAIVGMLRALGGSAYVLEQSARQLAEEGIAHPVAGAEPIDQPVLAVMHLRNRTARLHRRILTTVRRQIAIAAAAAVAAPVAAAGLVRPPTPAGLGDPAVPPAPLVQAEGPRHDSAAEARGTGSGSGESRRPRGCATRSDRRG